MCRFNNEVIVVDIKNFTSRLPYDTVFDKQQFREMVCSIFPDYKEYSVSWLIKKLKEEKVLVSVGKGKYIRQEARGRKKRVYKYMHSDEYLDVEKSITQEFPLVTFQMWELIQFNEFVNHQLSKNILIVEVENMLENAVFEYLRDQYMHVLFCPDIDEFYRYRSEETTIVILKLVSEAPKPIENHSSPLEKLLVDLFTNKFAGKLIQRSEYRAILEDSFEKYLIDETKLFRYARRRNVDMQIREFIKENTKILPMSVR